MDDKKDNNFPAVVEGRIGDDLVQTVNARDLHRFLNLTRDFNQWMRDQVERARLMEGRDFQSYEDVGLGPRARKEFALTIDAAKHIAMMSGSDRGFEVREYFLTCERKMRAGITAEDLLSNPRQLLAIAQGYALQIEDMRRDMAVMKSDVDAYERIAGADDLFGVRVAAKLLQMQERKFIQSLTEKRWAYRQLGTKHLLGYADKIQSGLCTNKATTYTKLDGSEGVKDTLKFTAKGLTRLAKALNVVIAEGDLLAARNGELAV